METLNGKTKEELDFPNSWNRDFCSRMWKHKTEKRKIFTQDSETGNWDILVSEYELSITEKKIHELGWLNV